MIVTTAEVFNHGKLDPGTAYEEGLESILEGLEADLREYLGRPLVVGPFTEENPRVDRLGQVRVRNTPLRTVTAFTIDATAIPSDQYQIKTWGLTGIAPSFLPSPLISPVPTVSIAYTAGLRGDDPDDPDGFGQVVRTRLIRKALAVYNKVIREDQAGVDSSSIEGTTIKWATTETWSEEELARFRRWKKRTVR